MLKLILVKICEILCCIVCFIFIDEGPVYTDSDFESFLPEV